MNSLSKIVEELINESPFVREALSEGLINTSALARKIKEPVESKLGKTINDSAIIMAINRLPISQNVNIERKIKNVMLDLGELIVRSNLVKLNYQNYKGISKNQSTLLSKTEDFMDSFYTVSRGIAETTIITNAQIKNEIVKIFNPDFLMSQTSDLSAITLKLPQDNTEVDGIYYYILKKIAWKGISIEEVISTTNEFTIVVKSELISQTFSVLMELKTAIHV